jgi:hypothetical protein
LCEDGFTLLTKQSQLSLFFQQIDTISGRLRHFSSWAAMAFAGPEIGGDPRKLVEGGLQVLDDFGRQNGWIGQIGRVAQAVVWVGGHALRER